MKFPAQPFSHFLFAMLLLKPLVRSPLASLQGCMQHQHVSGAFRVPPDLKYPLKALCFDEQVFTTVYDGQQELCFLVLQGDKLLASANQLLGQFQLGPLPPSPAGTLKIELEMWCVWNPKTSNDAISACRTSALCLLATAGVILASSCTNFRKVELPRAYVQGSCAQKALDPQYVMQVTFLLHADGRLFASLS